MEPKAAFDEAWKRYAAIGPLIFRLRERSQSALEKAVDLEREMRSSNTYPSRFALEVILEKLKEARETSLKAWRLTKDLHQFVVENEDALATAVVTHKKGNGHHPPEANRMEAAGQGGVCGGDVCITEEGVKVLDSCCNTVVGEEQCRILFLRFKTGELSPEEYLSEIERLAGPVPDREEKLAQIREILNPPLPGPDEEGEEEDRDEDEDEDPERVHEGHQEGECEPCNLAAAVQQLAPIGNIVAPDKNEGWYNEALEEKMSVWRYSDLLMQEAVKKGMGQEIELIDEVQKILRGMKADKK